MEHAADVLWMPALMALTEETRTAAAVECISRMRNLANGSRTWR